MNPKTKKLKIKDIIERATAVSSDDGDTVYRNIVDCINDNMIVELDFSEITILTTAFLNSAIGQLYNDFSSEKLNKTIVFKNIANEDKILFKKVTERAREYFKDKKGFEDSANDAIYGK